MLLPLLACVEPSIGFGDGPEPADGEPGETDAPEDTGEPLPDETGDTAPLDTAEPDTGDTAADPEVAWAGFEAGREDMLRALAEPILACVARDDSSAAAFDGCYDWHSAVHGHWALFTLARLLDDPSYAEAAEAQLTEEDLAIELASIEADRLGEVPYGYAWFLLLGVERARQGGTDLDPLADAAATVLDAHLSALGPSQARNAALADDYENASWAALNLWRWAVWVGDAEVQGRTESFVRDQLVPLDEDCPLWADITDTDNFFPACLMRAHTILTVLPAEEADAWVAANLTEELPFEPVTSIPFAHVAGLNFSRSWGMWSIYVVTGDTIWRDRVRAHVEWHVAHPEFWARDYYSYAHWVPQFGVYAIAQTLDEAGPA